MVLLKPLEQAETAVKTSVGIKLTKAFDFSIELKNVLSPKFELKPTGHSMREYDFGTGIGKACALQVYHSSLPLKSNAAF